MFLTFDGDFYQHQLMKFEFQQVKLIFFYNGKQLLSRKLWELQLAVTNPEGVMYYFLLQVNNRSIKTLNIIIFTMSCCSQGK